MVSLKPLSIHFIMSGIQILRLLISTSNFALYIGRHCCLWCEVQLSQLKLTSTASGTIPRRTLESIKKNCSEFLASGANLKKVKEFMNVAYQPFLDIPLTQVNMW